jgi:hypothetical protein
LPHLLATILEKTPRCVAWFIPDKVTRANKNANYYPRPAVLGKGASLASARALSPHSGDATMDGIVIIAFTAFLMILVLLCWEQCRHEQHRKELDMPPTPPPAPAPAPAPSPSPTPTPTDSPKRP